MQTDIYRFFKMPDWYIYLPQGAALDTLPDTLRTRFGRGELVLSLDLAAREKLARANINEVEQKLADQGYFVQAPPNERLQAQALNAMAAAKDKQFD